MTIEDYPDTAPGRASAWLDMIGEEHTHQDSLEPSDMKENYAQLARMFAGTVVEPADMHEMSMQLAMNVVGQIVETRSLDLQTLVSMVQGVCTTGAVIGARIQAGLHG